MKIALILPPNTQEERYDKKIAKAVGTLPPVGLLSIAAVLEQYNHRVKIIDGSIETLDEINKQLDAFKPEIIGLTAVTVLWPKIIGLVPQLKLRFPNCFIVIGGIHPTIFKERCLEECPEADALVIGDGEYTLVEIAERLEKNEALKGVKGVFYRDGNQIVTNKQREPIQNLDELPFPARGLIDVVRYVPSIEQYKRLPVTNIIGTRGCSFNCLFCSKIGGTARFRSAQNIFEEIQFLVEKFKIREIAFWDDIFTLKRRRVIELCSLLKNSKMDIIWSAQSRVNTIDQDLVAIMKRAGCWKLFFGVESLVQKNLDTLNKMTTVQNAFDAIHLCRKESIETEASFIFGIPGETFEDGKKTIELMKKLNPHYVKCLPLTPVPGTELYKLAKELGTFITTDLKEYTQNRIVFVPNSMTKDQLAQLMRTAYRSFYLRPSYILDYMLRIRSFEDIRRAFTGISVVSSL